MQASAAVMPERYGRWVIEQVEVAEPGPNAVLVRVVASDARALAAGLIAVEGVESVEIDREGRLRVLSRDVVTLQRELPRVAQARDVRLLRVEPLDDSLESVFEYLAQQ